MVDLGDATEVELILPGVLAQLVSEARAQPGDMCGLIALDTEFDRQPIDCPYAQHDKYRPTKVLQLGTCKTALILRTHRCRHRTRLNQALKPMLPRALCEFFAHTDLTFVGRAVPT